MSLNLYQKFLYREVFCSYREKEGNEVKCTHPYSFGECDLELGPIVQEHFANIIFKPEGIKLVIKEPKKDRIGDVWKEEDLDLKIGEESNKEEIIEKVKEKTKDITKKNRKALIQRINDIFQRYEFLFENDNPPGILGEKREEKAPEEEEELFEEEEEFFAKEREELFEEEEEAPEEGVTEEVQEAPEEDLFESEEEDLFEDTIEKGEDKREGTTKKNGDEKQKSEEENEM